jgi:rhodanese-related sulfurtransferase
MPKVNLRAIMPLLLIVALAIGLTVTGEYFGHQLEAGQTSNQIAKEITPEEAFNLIQDSQESKDLVILDVRIAEEFIAGHIAGAINLDYHAETFSDVIKVLDKNKAYIVYCKSGARSSKTLGLMAVLHFTEVYDISGGLIAWQEAGLPTVE